MYKERVKVRYSEMDFGLALKPSAVLNFFQDMASENAENLGFGYSYITPKHLAWYLLKYRIEFFKYPVGLYNLTLKTQPRGYNKIFAFRDFEIWNEAECLAKAASSWSLVDINSGKPVSVADALGGNPLMPPYQKQDEDLAFQKIKLPDKIDIEKTFEIRYDDIDVNQHANNCNYIIWAFEPLSLEFRSSHCIKNIDLVFKKEIKFGNTVLSQIEIADNNRTVHVLKNVQTGEDLCFINVEWNQRQI